MNPAPKGQRRFVCVSCKMAIEFPPEHSMEQKLLGSYMIQDQWFCSQSCFNEIYFPQEAQEAKSSERLKTGL